MFLVNSFHCNSDSSITCFYCHLFPVSMLLGGESDVISLFCIKLWIEQFVLLWLLSFRQTELSNYIYIFSNPGIIEIPNKEYTTWVREDTIDDKRPHYCSNLSFMQILPRNVQQINDKNWLPIISHTIITQLKLNTYRSLMFQEAHIKILT